MIKTIVILYHYFKAKLLLKFPKFLIKAWQKKGIKKICQFSSKHSKFYQQRHFDLINKKIMMENFEAFNTLNISKDQALKIALDAEKTRLFNQDINGITIGLSSGTSGNCGLFLVSEKERLAWCGNMLAKMLPLPPWKKQKIAFFLRANSNLYETVASKTLTFAYFDLFEDSITLKEKLNAFNPDVLVAPPSQLLKLIGTCYPKRVISIAETLLFDDKIRLEKGFNQKIHQVYQALEGFIAFTCTEGHLHLNEDLLSIEKEYLDDKRFVPILTDISRKTQPIIRYRLDDILTENNDACPCGCAYQRLEQIEGRSDDVLYVKTLKGVAKPLFPDFIIRRIIVANPNIETFEIQQTSVNDWQIYIEPIYQNEVLNALFELFKDIESFAPTLTFVDTPFPKSLGSKYRRIRRMCEAL